MILSVGEVMVLGVVLSPYFCGEPISSYLSTFEWWGVGCFCRLLSRFMSVFPRCLGGVLGGVFVA